jgi:hypothetical protein
VKPRKWPIFLAFTVPGALLTFVVASWMPLWRVELPNRHLADMPSGSFWQFLDNVPGALENLSTPKTPENVLNMLPSVYFWDNVGTTAGVFLLGAALGVAFWFAWRLAGSSCGGGDLRS